MRFSIRDCLGWKVGIRLLVTVCAVWLLSQYLFNNRDAFSQAITFLSPEIFCGMLLSQSLISLTFGCAFHAVLKAQQAPIQFRSSIRIFAVSQFLGSFIPHSGLVYRGYALNEESGFAVEDYVPTAVAFSWFVLITSMVIALVILVLADLSVLLFRIDSRLIIGLALLAGIVAPLLGHHLLQLLPAVETRSGTILKRVQRVSNAIVSLLSHRKLTAEFFLYSVINFVLTCIAFYFAFRAGGQLITIEGLALLFVAFRMSALVNFTPGNIGLLELALGYIASVQGLEASDGVLAMLLIRVVGFAATVLLAGGLGGMEMIRGIKIAAREGTV